jgi:hypothetical protein
MFESRTSPKWAIDSRHAAVFVKKSGLIVRDEESGYGEDYREEWGIPTPDGTLLRFSVVFQGWSGCNPRPMKNPSGSFCGLVGGEKLGGYVGVSLHKEWDVLTQEHRWVYHVGTPWYAKSPKLVEAMKYACANVAEASAEETASVFTERDKLLELLDSSGKVGGAL